jgi:hypothetical protein
VDFLSPAYQADHHSPFAVPVKIGQKKLWLRLTEVGNAFAALHKVGSLLKIPGALGLIENDDMIEGRIVSA